MGDAVLAVDVGGTFTDAAVIAGGRLHTAKTPTTPGDQSAGVIAAAMAALEDAGLSAADVASFTHGMTVTTNAMLEGRFARTALIATAGFTDVEELGRQDRPELYRLETARPRPIVPPELRFGVDERCGPDGVIQPLDERSARDALEGCAKAGVESVAICLLFSFRHPEHELRIGELARDLLPGVHVSLSHEVVGTFREYERCATTIADAALSPLLGGYVGRLLERSRDAGLPEPDIMLSTGGTVAAPVAAASASWTVLSGPAGGAYGAARSAARGGFARAVGFDMGGTSTDVAVAEDGRPLVTSSRRIGGRPVALPAIDVFTVGAGGGSIAWLDAGGALRVGPRSAGAVPGPACYGHGGDQPTVTDANLLLGYIGRDAVLAGGVRLDAAAAERAIEELATRAGLGPIETATGIVELANLEMLRATATATVARGVDPRDHALVAFGGAGPMHAAAIAAELGIETVVCPAACGVLSAYGMAIAGRRRDVTIGVVSDLAEIDPRTLAELTSSLRRRALAGLGDHGRIGTAAYDLRYRGQAFELTVERALPVAGDAEVAALADDFHELHRSRYGFDDRTAAIELVSVRLSAVAPRPADDAVTVATGETSYATRVAYFEGQPCEATVVRGCLPAGERITGPAILELSEATVVVPPGWVANVTADGSVELGAGARGGSERR